MDQKIRVIIADDNEHICNTMKVYLNKFNNIEVLGIANNDEEEIKLIEELKPEIVITDIVRNGEYTGLDIIKQYSNRENAPKFLVISADNEFINIDKNLKIDGYIHKPFTNYDVIIEKIETIKINN